MIIILNYISCLKDLKGPCGVPELETVPFSWRVMNNDVRAWSSARSIKLERRIRVSLPILNLHKTNRPHVCLTAVSSLERIPHGDERAWKRLTFGEDRTVRWGQIFTGNRVLAVSGKFLTHLDPFTWNYGFIEVQMQTKSGRYLE